MKVITRLLFSLCLYDCSYKDSKINFAWKLCFNLGISLSKYKDQMYKYYVNQKDELFYLFVLCLLSLHVIY